MILRLRAGAGLFVSGFVESDDIHIRSAVVEAKQVCIRLACMIAVIVTINSHGPAACASAGVELAEFLGPDQCSALAVGGNEHIGSTLIGLGKGAIGITRDIKDAGITNGQPAAYVMPGGSQLP